MPRCGKIRKLITEYDESPKIQKISFIPPFLILFLEIILIWHALNLNEMFVIIITLILLAISFIEMMLVSREIHERYIRNNLDKILTIKLDDFITEKKEKNVRKIIEDFIQKHPEYTNHWSEVYHTTCQILETHKEEELDKNLTDKLKTFIERKKKLNVDEIVELFVKNYPKYSRYKSEVYKKTCQIKSNLKKK